MQKRGPMRAPEWLLLPWAALVALPIWLLFILPVWALDWITRDKLTSGSNASVFFTTGKGPRLWVRRWSSYRGLSLPFAAIIRQGIGNDFDRVYRHEMRHCRQWLILGPLFPIVYGLQLVLYGYERHPLEMDARNAEGAPV